MAPRATWRLLPTGQRDCLERLARSPGWRIVPVSELADVLPETLMPKLDAVMVVAQPTSTGGVYLMLNPLRIDGEEVDQQPFGVIVSSTGASSSGVWADHGPWSGRTVPLPADFWDVVNASSIGSYYCARPPDGVREGTLDQLSGGHRGAFEWITNLLRRRKASKREQPGR